MEKYQNTTPKHRNPSKTAKTRILTNSHQIKIKNEQSRMYQYDITFEPPLPQDSRPIIKGCVKSAKAKIQQKIGPYVLRGKTIYGFKKLKNLYSFQCKYEHNKKIPSSSNQKNNKLSGDGQSDDILQIQKQIQEDEGYEPVVITNVMTLHLTKELDMKSLQNNPNAIKEYEQVLNSCLKMQFTKTKKVEIGKRGVFYDSNFKNTADWKIFQGFTAVIHPLNGSLYVTIDAKSKIISKKSLLTLLDGMNDDQKYSLNGRYVRSNYSNYRVYKIIKIVSNKTVDDRFYKSGELISFFDYYKKAYGIAIKNKKQKLILSQIKTTKMNKQGVQVEQEIDVYLVPELVSLVGLTEQETHNIKKMRQISSNTKMQPKTKRELTKTFIKEMNSIQQNIFQIEEDYSQVKQKLFQQPTIKFNQEKVKALAGIFQDKKMFLEPMQLKNWICIYSHTEQQDYDNALNFFKTLKKCQKVFGVTINQPNWVQVDPFSEQKYIKSLQIQMKKRPDTQIVVSILKTKEEKYYKKLKQLLLCDYKIPHQAVTVKLFQKLKMMGVVSKILRQINAKLGHPICKVLPQKESLKDRSILTCSLVENKKQINGKYCVALTGTVDESMCNFYRGCKLVEVGKSRTEPIFHLFKECIKSYYSKSGAPQTLIVYRDGINPNQFQQIVKNQIPLVDRVVEVMKQKVSDKKLNNYKLEVVYIIVNKKVSRRMFREEGKQLMNPQSGTLIQGYSSEYKDFYLSPHYVTQGTCTPTLFTIVHNTSKLNYQDIQRLTFESCFGYPNWSGAVRVPATLQYAAKEASFVLQNMKKQPSEVFKNQLICL